MDVPSPPIRQILALLEGNPNQPPMLDDEVARVLGQKFDHVRTALERLEALGVVEADAIRPGSWRWLRSATYAEQLASLRADITLEDFLARKP